MASAHIVLVGLGTKFEGLKWESDRSLRIGRLGTLDVVLRDFSVERIHAEVKHSGAKWVVRDLAESDLYPTLVNGVALAGGQRELHDRDVLQVGKVSLKVATASIDVDPPKYAVEIQTVPEATQVFPVLPAAPPPPGHVSGLLVARRPSAPASEPSAQDPFELGRVRTSVADMRIHAVAHQTWDQALESVATDRKPLPGQAMLTLLRANHHLANLSNLDQLLESILADALTSLSAQRGAILLLNPITDQLESKLVAAPSLTRTGKGYSKTLSERCYRRGESMLCQDVQADQVLVSARSVQQGAMSSVLCALLRTPRRKLGVLHLDRGPLQDPFSENDLYLADAVAASVALGIECAQVVEQQREQFVETVTSLARAVEMRDQYTGDHTKRVTDYALFLAEELKVPYLEKFQLQVGTPLHDIGKIGVDDAILRKPGKLTTAEFDLMKAHTVKGAAIVASIGSLQTVIPIIRHHHERWDGSGYPDKLGREQIALTARIVAVADAFDAMTSHRPYRPAMPPQLAYLELLSKAGTHFDPGCVQAFVRVRSKVENRMKLG